LGVHLPWIQWSNIEARKESKSKTEKEKQIIKRIDKMRKKNFRNENIEFYVSLYHI
jgi:hypothetical protein